MKVLISIFCFAVLLVSCGTVRSNIEVEKTDQVEIQVDTIEKRDTFVPLHPPVVIPHPWNAEKDS